MKFLNKKEAKKLLKEFGNNRVTDLHKRFIFMLDEDRMFIASDDVRRVPLEHLHVKRIGLLFARWKDNTFELTRETAQLFLA